MTRNSAHLPEGHQKRIRAVVGGRVVVDTHAPVLVWEWPFYPTYHLPVADVDLDALPAESFRRVRLEVEGVPVDLVRVEWSAMDQWFEEDEPVEVHARDPYVRIDALASSRHVEVAVDGVVLADSTRPTVLFETRLPPRFYLPLPDLRLDLLRPSDTVTHCPYKGTATYFSVELPDGTRHPDLFWIYRAPLPESQKVAGLAAVWTEKVDLRLDGVDQERPRTHFEVPGA
ncbi:MAG TPA: DUF427 domain-containing protein [Actinomycetospora sp.]|jgi:uncharacterized protein (DUF427 family)|uniref:DUF427 domain-containing protein n=1 Tax=Actinomycetospora sp. TaxID=1872135 RepID=UPI002F3E2BE5